MNKITTLHLNGVAYQIEESGYEALKAYLDKARTDLHDNPDMNEIMSDLEQAIADKCSAYLNNHKNVILSSEIKKIVDEMGPINAGDHAKTESGEKTESKTENSSDTSGTQGRPKRLYQIREGAIISGVCNGLAAYLNIDVSIVRIAFIVLTVVTGGGFIGAYILMMFFVPYADTPEQKASAFDIPLTAQELVNRAKNQYNNFRENGGFHNKNWTKDVHDQWKQEQKNWKHSKHQMHREMRRTMQENKRRWQYERSNYSQNTLMGVLRPLVDTFIALVWICFFIIVAFFLSHHRAEVLDVWTHAVAGWHILVAWIKSW